MRDISYNELKELLLEEELRRTIERRQRSRIFFINTITCVRVRPVVHKMNIVLHFPVNRNVHSRLKEVEWSIGKELRWLFKGIDEEF